MFPSLKLAFSLLAATIVQAQTTTECDPLVKTCPNNPALPAKLSSSFSHGMPPGWRQVPCKGSLSYGPGGVSIGYKELEDCTSIETIGMALFGLFEVKMKAAPGKGIVSSVVLQSDVRDEVDWEFLGGEDYRVQSNYFGKGDTTTYDRMIYVPVPNNQAEYHTYGINWTSTQIIWTLNGAPVRTLNYAEAKGGSRFPQTPARLKIGIWAAPTDQPGIVQWAGGVADASKGPFAMTVSDVNIVNYTPGKEYRYKDRTGNWESIEVIKGPAAGMVGPDQETSNSGTVGQPQADSTASATPPMTPKPTGGSLPPSPPLTGGNHSANSSTAASGSAQGTKASNSSAASVSNGATSTSQYGSTSVAIAGLSLLFLAFLA
ncbi:hypothetical protein E2P81_ATG06179 [Venturia nashicola]|uniref:chitinase n=1 Tax=Venturia nashicola TaxID=86259 RepID=A0A4Z1P7Z1_9PEZI|nr:hypothetical protein E6O75_ATG06320 [Venturia nashicola]TLD27833.1 hypothetical protein E2P81_ATG06179 [Venturia nashicola]